MDNFDLTKYLAEGRLLKEETDWSNLKADFSNSTEISFENEDTSFQVSIEQFKKDFDGFVVDTEGKKRAIDKKIFDITLEDYEENWLDEGKLFEEDNSVAIEYLKDAFQLYLEGGDDFEGAPGDIEIVVWDEEEYGDSENYDDADQFKSTLQSLATSPISLQIPEYGKVTFKRKGNDIIGSFIIPEAEGKLNEAMSPQDVVDIADTVAEEFTKESADAGEFLVYSVGKMEGEGFELDTDLTSQTPKNIDTRGVGEGWGGIFRIKPNADGYEVRNAEKGGLVAMIDGSGNFRMLSADESRAEMGLEENKEETKSNKMKKSELKEMIKSAFLGETSVEETLVDADQDMADAILNALGGEAAFEAVVRAMSTDDAQTYLGAIMRDHDIEMGPVGDIPGFEGTMDALDSLSIREEEEEDVEVDVDVEDTEEEGDIEVKSNAKVGLTGEKEDIQDNLEAALEAAKALGDQKLVDQIGNSITFFTRTHVVGKDEVSEGDTDNDRAKDAKRLGKKGEDNIFGAGVKKGEKIEKAKLKESIEFPMWNKIK